jgi:hypothetical protein
MLLIGSPRVSATTARLYAATIDSAIQTACLHTLVIMESSLTGCGRRHGAALADSGPPKARV